MLYTANAETGMKIEEVETIKEGLDLIYSYENQDRIEGSYNEGWYDIVNEDHESVLKY